MGKGRGLGWGACLAPEEGMSGMVIIMVPVIGKGTLRGVIIGISIMRGNDSSGDNGEEGNASPEQEREKHDRNGAGEEP